MATGVAMFEEWRGKSEAKARGGREGELETDEGGLGVVGAVGGVCVVDRVGVEVALRSGGGCSTRERGVLDECKSGGGDER